MSKFADLLIGFAIARYRLVALIVLLFTMVCGMFIPFMTIDTDPENMLETTEPARLFHDEIKRRFNLSESIVLGVINEHDPDGVFNPETLKRIFELTEYARTLQWPEKGDSRKMNGVVEARMIAPSMVDHISQSGSGAISFDWLMKAPPATREESLQLRKRAMENPLLRGQMISEDGKAVAIVLPLTRKLISYEVSEALTEKIKRLNGREKYYLAGLPVAESAIGVEMFSQMVVAGPLTMLVIFALLFIFFRKLVLIVLPMIVAAVSVVAALGLMIAAGFPVHILSSMLPIFLMPIAICDTVHILSDFFQSYTRKKGREQTIKEVMQSRCLRQCAVYIFDDSGRLSFVCDYDDSSGKSIRSFCCLWSIDRMAGYCFAGSGLCDDDS
jgi:hypothetical protein